MADSAVDPATGALPQSAPWECGGRGESPEATAMQVATLPLLNDYGHRMLAIKYPCVIIYIGVISGYRIVVTFGNQSAELAIRKHLPIGSYRYSSR